MRPCCRVIEGGVGGEPRSAVSQRIISFEEKGLVSLHVRKVVPAVVWVEGEHVDLPGAVAVLQVCSHEVLRGDGLSVAHRQRGIFHWSLGRSPHIDLNKAPLQPRLGLLGRQESSYALRTRARCIVIVRHPHWLLPAMLCLLRR